MKSSLLLWLILLCGCSAFSQTSKHLNLSESGLAIDGYDPVSYIATNKAGKGIKSNAFKYEGAIYYFESKAHLDMFKSNPQKYQPAYGGWCAFAMGDAGEKVKIDPETFKVINGKTYLFYNFFFNNTLSSWNKNELLLRKKADLNWNKIIQ